MLRGKFRLDVPALLRASDRLLFLHHRRVPPTAATTTPLGPDPAALTRAEAATGWPLPALHPPELLPPATVARAGPYRARALPPPIVAPPPVVKKEDGEEGEVAEVFPGLDRDFHEALARDPQERRQRRRREERRRAKEAAVEVLKAEGNQGDGEKRRRV